MYIDWDVTDKISVLSIVDTTTLDSGEYSAMATNDFGTATAAATVTVSEAGQPIKKLDAPADASVEMEKSDTITEKEAAPEESATIEQCPKFEIAPEPTVVSEGEALKLTCKVAGWTGLLLSDLYYYLIFVCQHLYT